MVKAQATRRGRIYDCMSLYFPVNPRSALEGKVCGICNYTGKNYYKLWSRKLHIFLENCTIMLVIILCAYNHLPIIFLVALTRGNVITREVFIIHN